MFTHNEKWLVIWTGDLGYWCGQSPYTHSRAFTRAWRDATVYGIHEAERARQDANTLTKLGNFKGRAKVYQITVEAKPIQLQPERQKS